MKFNKLPACGLLIFGAALGTALFAAITHAPARHARAQTAKSNTPDLATILAELETIKGKLPDQAHAMQDVGYHFTNLWFAGKQANWELASFYWAETRSHLRWAVRIIPKRKDTAGREIDLQAILQSLENAPLKQLEDSIKARDGAEFEKSYRFTLEGCYACHKASDKPFIRLRIPSNPETQIVNFDPGAEWPK